MKEDWKKEGQTWRMFEQDNIQFEKMGQSTQVNNIGFKSEQDKVKRSTIKYKTFALTKICIYDVEETSRIGLKIIEKISKILEITPEEKDFLQIILDEITHEVVVFIVTEAGKELISYSIKF